ncbi:MAG: tetratricopeptide repeat protein [Leptolyngbyaceae cyanobacterium]
METSLTSVPVFELAFCRTHLGSFKTALLSYQQALEMRRELLGERHPDVAGSLFSLGALRYRQGQPEEALSLLLEARAIYKVTLGLNHPTAKNLQTWIDASEAALG